MPQSKYLSAFDYDLGSIAKYGATIPMRSGRVVRYLRAVGWVTQTDRLALTPTGHAIVDSADRLAQKPLLETDGVVIFSPQDPMNFAALTRSVGDAGAGMLVDPYFTDEFFQWLSDSTTIARVLLCRDKTKVASLSYCVGAAHSVGREIEVRYLARKSLHDRYLLTENGDVSMIGASLNGLHKHFTTLVPFPTPAAKAVNEYIEGQWDDATQIDPRVAPGSSAPQGDEGK